MTAAALILGIVFLGNIGFSDTEQKEAKKELVWVKYDDGIRQAAKENKPVFVDFYTNWCGWCKKMDRETFSDAEVMKYLGDNFILVKVNAESNLNLVLDFGNITERDLSKSFGVRGYPTYWFLNSEGGKILNFSGYRTADRFLPIIEYIGGGHYKSKTYKEFEDSRQSN